MSTTTSKPRPAPPGKCPKCKAPVSWWINANRTDRKVAVDQSWDTNRGTVLQIVTGTGDDRKVYAKVLTEREVGAAVANGDRLYVLHALTCSAGKPVNRRPSHVRLDLPKKRNGARR